MKNLFTPFISVFILTIIFTAFDVPSAAVAGTPPQSTAEDIPQFYTIQAGSYRAADRARIQYRDLAGTLLDNQRGYLRIERIGSYYTVRLGRFDRRNEAESLLGQAEEQLPGAMILQAYIKEERILAMMQPTLQAVMVAAQELRDFPAARAEVGEEPALEMKTAEETLPDVEPAKEIAVVEAELPAAESREPVEKTAPDLPPAEDPVDVPATEEILPEKIDAEISDTSASEPTIAVVAAGVTSSLQVVGAEEAADDAEDGGREEERKFEALGQPTGILPIRVVKVITKGMFGDVYRYPSILGYDSYMDEIYVIGGAGMHPSSRIIIYGPDYFPVASLGDGRQVINPRGIAIDRQGNIYISQSASDGKPHRLTVLNGAFFIEREVFLDQSIPGMPENFYPYSVALSDERIYIGGDHKVGVLVLDRNYNFVEWLVPKMVRGKYEMGGDPADPDALVANDVVVDRNGRIYILCPDEGKIFVLDEAHRILFSMGVKGGSTGKLSRPRSLAVDVNREIIYVVDYMRHAIVVYNYENGKYLFELGGMGFEPGWFHYPTNVEVDRRGNLIVADYFNHRVQVLYVP